MKDLHIPSQPMICPHSDDTESVSVVMRRYPQCSGIFCPVHPPLPFYNY